MNKPRFWMNKKDFFTATFIVAMVSLFCAFFYYVSREGTDSFQLNIIYGRGANYLADFFNVAKYSASKDPYHDTTTNLSEKGYLPISYLLFYLLGQFADYKTLDATTAGYSASGLAFATLIVGIFAAILLIQLYDLKDGNKFVRFMTVMLFTCSSVFIFAYERGNIIFLAVSLCLFFLVCYKSENKILRELALISLAFAAALKGYPAILGLLLIHDKKFFAAVRCCIYGLLLMFLPFLFFIGGFNNVHQWYKNVKANTAQYRYYPSPRYGIYYFLKYLTEFKKYHVEKILLFGSYALYGLGILSTFFHKKLWKIIAILVAIIIFMPVNSAVYCGLYILPVIVLFLNDDEHSWFDFVYLLFFILILCPMQFSYHSQNLTLFLNNVALLGILGFLTLEGIILLVKKIVKWRRGRKNVNKCNSASIQGS